MDYAEGLKDVLVRKINKAEQSLYGLKLDYCRFVFGLSHRSQVIYDQVVYQVKSVDLESMTRLESGEWSRPSIAGVRLNERKKPINDELVNLGQNWDLFVEP